MENECVISDRFFVFVFECPLNIRVWTIVHESNSSSISYTAKEPWRCLKYTNTT